MHSLHDSRGHAGTRETPIIAPAGGSAGAQAFRSKVSESPIVLEPTAWCILRRHLTGQVAP